MLPAVLVLALAVLCGIRAANRDDNWVEAGTPRAQDDATQQTETAVTQIINQNTVRPNTQSVAYSTITGQPDSNPALADEEYQSLKQRVIRANHTSFSQLFDAIRDTCSEALAPFEKKVQTAPVTADEDLLDVGWGESLDHNYEKMAQAGNAQFEKYFNRQVSALKKACQLRIEEAKAGDFIQLHSSVTPVASWVQYHAGAVSELWIRLEDNSKQALKLATKAKQLRAKLDQIKKNDLKEAKKLHLFVAEDGSDGYARNASLNRHIGTQKTEAQQRLTEQVNQWIERTATVEERLKQSCMLRISEAKRAAGVVIGIEPTLAWPEGFQTGSKMEQAPIKIVPVDNDDHAAGADLIATKLLEDLKATQMIQSSWGLQDEGLNTDGLKKALIQLQKDWQGKFEQLKMRFDQQCRMKVLATQMNAKGNERAAKAH